MYFFFDPLNWVSKYHVHPRNRTPQSKHGQKDELHTTLMLQLMKYESMNCSSGRDSESHETTSEKTIRTIQNFRMNHLAIQDYQS